MTLNMSMSMSSAMALQPIGPFPLSAAERHEFARELAMVSRLWRSRMSERLKAFEMTMPCWAALYWLWQAEGGVSQTVLAERAAVEPGTLVRTIDLLERQGLVERVASPHDRRVNLLHLTQAAHPIIAKIDKVADEVRAEAMGEIDPEEARAAMKLLRGVRAALA
ncbi:MAG: hypothetical protein B7Y99_04730 [Caulobacterales bacterium 32-69-10]|nr:MAG: hypothetical protein B7Y99_04730 [Caulobacterales bacterium 32-69-10]